MGNQMEISRRVQELEAENLAMKATLEWIKRDVRKVDFSTEMSDIFRTLAGISWLCSDKAKSIAIEMAYKTMEKDSRESEKSREQMKEQETE
nr:MAG TPA: hypothetical protein [Caudoviricetes sp.]